MLLRAFKALLVTSTITTTLAVPLSQRDISASAEIFPAGDCSGNSINSFWPPIGVSYYGQCTNFMQGGNYGAKYTASSNCRFKSWELPDCHGKATVHYPNGDTCIPIGNKDGALYLWDGASSLSVECDDDSTVTITLPPTTVTTTATTTMTLTSVFHTGPPPSTYTEISTQNGFVGADGSFAGQLIPGLSPGTPVEAQSATEVQVQVQVEYFNDKGEKMDDSDTDSKADGEPLTDGEMGDGGDANGVNEGSGGEEGEDTPQEHQD